MALRPPDDFNPPSAIAGARPSMQELVECWEAEQQRRARKERDRAWRHAQESVRRTSDDQLELHKANTPLPAFLRDPKAFGPHARAALRTKARCGRVVQAGVDTWSPSWYVSERGPASRTLRHLASSKAGRAWMLPDEIAGHRVGWFPDSGLVFAEGHPFADGLGSPQTLPAVLEHVERRINDYGIAIGPDARAGLRRLDAAVDLAMDSKAEGLALLAGVGALVPPSGKVVPWRRGRLVESVLLKTLSGATRARVYDKGLESGLAARGRLIRPEAQCRYPKATRRHVEEFDTAYVREQFRRRLTPLWDAAQGIRTGDYAALAERAGEAISRGELTPSRRPPFRAPPNSHQPASSSHASTADTRYRTSRPTGLRRHGIPASVHRSIVRSDTPKYAASRRFVSQGSAPERARNGTTRSDGPPTATGLHAVVDPRQLFEQVV